MKKITTLILILTIMLIFGAQTVFAVQIPQTVRVGLFFGSTAKQNVQISSSQGFFIGNDNNRTFASEKESASQTLTVSASGSTVTVSDSSGAALKTGTSVAVSPKSVNAYDQIFTIDGKSYRGWVNFAVKDGKITVINLVNIELYLYGVVSREMDASWPKEALKAQAVCARNYVANNIDKHSSYGFDVCAGVDCQAYSGTEREAESIYAAVDETAAAVVTYGGNLAQLYYSASMGSTTENVKYVWGNEVPYLVSVDNSYEDTANVPNGYWSGTLTSAEASTIMRNKGYDVGEVTGIEALEYSPSGRVIKLRVAGTKGEHIFDLERCRTIFNTVTKSQMYTVRGNKAPQNSAALYVYDGTNVIQTSLSGVSVVSASGTASGFNTVTAVDASGSSKTYTYAGAGGDLGISDEFYFSGTGWGHSVGMSQYGARGMANAGFSYKDILINYFPGTAIELAY